jgi:hypothetical protein
MNCTPRAVVDDVQLAGLVVATAPVQSRQGQRDQDEGTTRHPYKPWQTTSEPTMVR